MAFLAKAQRGRPTRAQASKLSTSGRANYRQLNKAAGVSGG